MISNVKKDITTVTTGIVAHGCNCLGYMGSGVARAIKHTWPQAYSKYVLLTRQYPNPSKKLLLGTVQIVKVGEPEGFPELYVANCFTQEVCGNDGKVYADINAINESLENVVAYAENYNLPLYLPKIGCGLGGLSWENDVEPLLIEISSTSAVEIVVCDWNE